MDKKDIRIENLEEKLSDAESEIAYLRGTNSDLDLVVRYYKSEIDELENKNKELETQLQSAILQAKLLKTSKQYHEAKGTLKELLAKFYYNLYFYRFTPSEILQSYIWFNDLLQQINKQKQLCQKKWNIYQAAFEVCKEFNKNTPIVCDKIPKQNIITYNVNVQPTVRDGENDKTP